MSQTGALEQLVRGNKMHTLFITDHHDDRGRGPLRRSLASVGSCLVIVRGVAFREEGWDEASTGPRPKRGSKNLR